MSEREPGVKSSAVEEWLTAELNRVWLLSERCLRQLQKARIRPQSDHPSMAEIEMVLTARRQARGTQAPAETELDAAVADAEARIDALRKPAPIGRLSESLGLRPLELEVLLFSLAPYIDPPLAELLTVLRGTSVRRGLDLALVAQIKQLKRTERVALLDCVDEERPLIAWRLIRVSPPDTPEAFASASYRAIQLSLDVVSVVCGRADVSASLHRACGVVRAEPSLDDLLFDEPVRERLVRAMHVLRDAAKLDRLAEVPWLLLYGQRGAGKVSAAARLAAAAGRPLLTFNPQLVDKAQLDETFRRALRDALIRGACLYVGPLTAEMAADNLDPVVRLLEANRVFTFFGVEAMRAPRTRIRRDLVEIELPLPTERTRLALWQRAIPEPTRGADLALPVFARGFQLTPGEIGDTAHEAQKTVLFDGARKIDHADVRVGIERRMRNELGEIARRIVPTARWSDLVLAPEDLARVQEFINRKLHADRVYNEWGLGRRISYGKGLIALFSGEPGTGKTMLAGLISQALDLELYQVDLAQVFSKWVGETEKALAKVFDSAERANAVLLFDEADALFSKRTDVDTAMDRYGNLAVNYLLQRLEQYTGVGVLTTNKDASLDEALQRRLSLHLRLDLPEVPERQRLWESLLVPSIPAVHDVDFLALAREFELTGGYIRNIVLRAAFLAAAEDRPVHMALLRRAAALEMEDMGRLVVRHDDFFVPFRDAPPALASGDRPGLHAD